MADDETHILRSWKANAQPWARAIADNEIASRIKLTNEAVTSAITAYTPKAVLDIGCGEGWLCRSLIGLGIDCVGVDAIDSLIVSARRLGPGHYDVIAYNELARYQPPFPVDLAVCNFSLLGNTSVDQVLAALPRLLPRDGTFIVQSLHPDYYIEHPPEKDGWQPGSWAGFSEDFCDPPPWYYRTVASWQNLFERFGLELIDTLEPALEDSDPGSIIFISRLL